MENYAGEVIIGCILALMLFMTVSGIIINNQEKIAKLIKENNVKIIELQTMINGVNK